MSALTKRLEARFEAFDADKLREQLTQAYMHMYRCADALRGKDVEPIPLDDEEDIGEELFYLCRKKALEENSDTDALKGYVSDFSTSITSDVRECPSDDIRGDIRREATKAQFSTGEKVYYWNGGIRHSMIETIEYDSVNGWSVSLENGTVLKNFDGLCRTKEALRNMLRKEVCDE